MDGSTDGMIDLEKVNKIGGIPTTPLCQSHHDGGAVFRRGRYRRTRSMALRRRGCNVRNAK